MIETAAADDEGINLMWALQELTRGTARFSDAVGIFPEFLSSAFRRRVPRARAA